MKSPMSEQPASKEVFSVRYTESIEGLTPEKLQGFFVGWPNKPSPEVHLELLKKCSPNTRFKRKE